MANYANLKATINANIKANGNEEITGPILNTVLNQAVTTLGAGYQYMGVATPATSPGTPDANVFYIAATPGTYTNFGGKVVADGEVAILKYNGSWTKEVSGAATAAQVTQLGQDVEDNTDNINALQAEIDAIQPIVIEGNVTNAPDEEDITTDENDLLKFKDRTQAVNQMGYVILRKDKTFASQVTATNTIYEIRYPFDLGGASVTIPAGCILKFNGGKIVNGTITGDGTQIEADAVQIFDGVTISGTWSVADVYSLWFSNDVNTINNVVSMTSDTEMNNIYIEGNYTISTPVEFKSYTNVYIKGVISGSIAIMFSVNDKDNIHFFGGVLDGLCESGGAYATNGGLLYFVYCRDVSVKDMTIKNAKCDAITLSRWGEQEKANERFVIENCIIDTAWRQGVSIVSAKNFRMSNCKIMNIWGTAPGAALDFENNTSLECEKIENVVIENVFIKDTHSGILFPDQYNNPAENILIKNVNYISSLNHRGNWFVPGSRMVVENCHFSCDDISNTYLIYPNTSSRDVIFLNCHFENSNLRFSNYTKNIKFECCNFVGKITTENPMVAFKCKFTLSSYVTFLHAENCEIEISASDSLSYVTLANGGKLINNKIRINGSTYYAVSEPVISSQCVICGNDIFADTQRATIILNGTKHIVRNNRIFDVLQKSYGTIAEYSYGHRCQVYFNDIVRRVWVYASPSVSFRHPSLNYSTTGATTERPQVLKQEDIGFKFYDSTLGKFIFLKDNGKYPKFKLQLSDSDINNTQASFATNFGIAETSNIPSQTTLAGLTNAIADALSFRLADVHSVNQETGEIVFCVARNQLLTAADITMTLGGNQLGTLTLTEAGIVSTWIDAAGTQV